MKKILATLLLINSTFLIAYAQLPPGGGANVPIDGGVVGLLAAGAAYGIYKMKKKEKAG